MNRIDPAGLDDIFFVIDLDLVGIFGVEFAAGFVIDTDHLSQSGYFFTSAIGAGANVGVGVGGGWAPRDIEGEGMSLDLNLGQFSPSLLFDNQGLNGFMVAFGPGAGASWSRGRTWNLGLPGAYALESDLDVAGPYCRIR